MVELSYSGGGGGGGTTLASGTILGWGGTIASVPTGYLFCNGAAVSRATFSSLFTAIGTIWGAGDGSTTFNLPDSRDMLHVGAKQDVSGVPKTNITGSLLQTGGSATHTHTYAMISHAHSVNPGTQCVCVNNSPSGLAPITSFNTNVCSGGSGTTGSASNVPPFLAYPSIIKT